MNELRQQFINEVSKDKELYNPRKGYSKSQITSLGYIADHNSYKVLSFDSLFAMTRIARFSDKNVPVITTDYLYTLLSSKARMFVIMHELGHFNCHEDIMLSNTIERTDNLEIEADNFAIEYVGKEIAINALNEMKSICLEILDGSSNDFMKEFDVRIEYIQNNYN